MVLPGQFLERATLIQTDTHVLEALWHRGTKHMAVILPPAPWEGGGMDHIVGTEISFNLTQNGHATLRFNYSGVGASQGQRATHPDELLEDARAAFKLACENRPERKPILISIGSSDAVALKLCAEESVRGLICVAPSLAGVADFSSLECAFHVIWPELETTHNRLIDLGSAVTRIPGANKRFNRNLPMVGRACSAFLAQV